MGMARAMNIFGVGAIVVTVIAILFFMQQTQRTATPTVVIIGDTKVRVDVAATPETRTQGLSGRRSLAEGEGLFFIFEQEGNWGFWMKGMLFPIDIIWTATDGTIITVTPNVTPETYPQAFYPTTPKARYVLEVPAGFAERHGIAEGGKLVVQ